ncbi:hypothetical protein [Paenibacillus sp. GCM10027626]|uniref:hypothetical protein n=1 Tax=Paenibacillus sp. GCM10027626 TaxID=3273411 RepID=UPI003630A22A
MEIFHIQETSDAIAARQRGREAARAIGLGLVDQTYIAYMISELALTLIQLPDKGHMVIRIIQKSKGESKLGIEVRAFDHCKGRLREPAFLKKLADELYVSNEDPRGMVTIFRKWLPVPARFNTPIYAAGEE